MDRFLVRKDVYEELEKAMRDRSHLVAKKVTDKNGHQRTVFVRGTVEQKEQKQKKVEEPAEKKERSSKMLKDDIRHGKYDKYIRVMNRDENDSDLFDSKHLKRLYEIINKDGNSENVDIESVEEELYERENALNNGAKSPYFSNEDRDSAKKELSEEPAEKKSAKPKYSEGDTVNLDGAKGDFKVQSIDKDGAYHVVSADGKKGYKVSENHITGNKDNTENKKEVEFEKKNNASKSEEIARKNDAENNVNDAIKLTDAEKKEIMETLNDPELQNYIKKYGYNEPTTIGNLILNNLSSIGKKDLFNKIRQQEWDYKDANNKHGNTFNSDYAKEAMYQLYQEYKNNPKKSEKKDYSTMTKNELLDAYNSTKDMDERDKIMAAYDKADKKESKTDLAGAEDKKMYDAYQQMADDEDKAFYESEKKEQYRNQLKEIKKNNPVEYMRFMDQANKDYQQYKDARDKADIVARSPMFASFPGYSTAKKEVEKWENKYPDFKEHADKNMAYYKFD